MNKSIFKWFSMLLLMMVAGMTGATAQSLTLDGFSIKAGETKAVAIKLAAENSIYGIQTDIVCEGLSLEGVAAVDNGLNFASNDVSGAKRVSLLSTAGDAIPAGDVITLTVKADDTFSGGTVKLTNTRLTTNTTGTEVKVDDVTANVTKELVISTMAVYGTFPGMSWDADKGIAMANTESEPAIWSVTLEGVAVEGTKYEYKAAANGNWDDYVLPEGDNADFVFGTDEYPAGIYNLTFTADTENHTLTLVADKQAEPVTGTTITLAGNADYTEGKAFLIEAADGASATITVTAGETVISEIMEDGVAMVLIENDAFTTGEFTITADKNIEFTKVTLLPNADASEGTQIWPAVEPEPVYTVVGNATAIFGTEWDVNAEANTLVKGEDGVYTKTYQNIRLANDFVIEYKVVKNHAYTNGQWGFGNDNATYTVWEGDGVYNVTFVFNPDAAVDEDGHNVGCKLEKQQEQHDPFNVELVAIDPADHSTVESLQNFTLTFGGQEVTVNSKVKPTLGDALGEIALNGDGSVSVTFASAQTNPGDYTLEIPAGAILYYGTAIDPLSFKYTIAGGADFTIDPAEGVVESLSTFTVNFSYYIEAPEATAYLFNEETEQEITANVYEGAGKSLTVMLSEEVTTPGDWQLNIEGVKKMDGTPVELIFSYTIKDGQPDQNYYILGDFWGWDNPKQMEESEGLYTLVIDATVEANKEYKYKLRQGDNWDGYQLPASGDYSTTFQEDGDYTLTFTANVTGEEIEGIQAYFVKLDAVKKGEPVVEPFDYELVSITPADRSTVESLQNFTLTFGEQPVTVNSEVKPTLTIANTEDVVATGEIKLNEDGPVSITFAEAVTTPGNYQLNIPDGAILYYGTAIDPLSFTYTIAGAADFTIDPAPGEVASLSTFNVTFNNYMVELGENAKAYLFNEETEAEIEADVYDLGGGTKLYVSLSEEVTTPGDWQLNIEGVNRMDTGDEIELIFDYTIKSTEPDMNYYILGDFWGWDNPKQMEATETEGIYTLVIDATVDAQKYEYKLRQGDNWNGYQLPADNSNYDFVFGTDEYPAGDYTLTFTFNRAEDKLVLDVQKKSDKPELDSYTYSFCQATNGWTTIDADGDGFTWYIYIDNNNPGYDSKPGLMTSASYANNKALTPDNYLVSPKMKLDGKISFYASAQDASYPSEHFGVAVSTASGTDAADFQMITEEMEMTSARELANAPAKGPRRVQGKWYFYEVDLSSFAGAEGYVAIRHYDCTDMFRLNVDGITLETSQLIDPYDPELEIEPGPEPEPEVVVVPEGLVVEEYSSAYTDYEGEEKTGSMNVGFDGTDVYIQGMCSYLSNAWVKGSLEGNTITFAGKQFFGTFANKYDMFLQNSDVVFIYDAEAGTLTSEDIIYTYSGNLYADYYVNLILTKVNEMAVTPATPSISGIQETSYGDIVVFEVPTVDVDGNGLATSKLSYQFFVDDENTPLVFTTEDFTRLTEDMTVIPYGFTESYDFYPTYIYLNMPHDTWTRIGIQSIYTGGGEENKSEIFWFEMPAGPVEAPDGLTTETYIFKANALEYSSSGGIEHPDYTLQVQVGFDGDDAYIQGLAADMQELWVKATKNEQGQYVIPANQYMGDLSFYGYTFPYYWTALDAENNLVDAVLDFDAETSTFTTEQTLALNGAAKALDYYLLFNDVIITKFVEVAATPANPTFEDFILSEEVGYTKIYASIPTVGTEGEALNTSKLFYIVWIEKDGVEQPYTFTADLYDQDFEEDVTEVPYSHDGYDIYKGGEIIYLEDAIEELATWTKVGIQSVYYGCDERNVSNIVWSDGTTTGIENLNSVKGDLSGAWYNLNGVRITKPTQKGLYIHNGKKVVIK